ncbi:diguanylate cyclase [Ralstonia sp. NFACC01]|uniref:diguanylate cyclase domain-containing protein n=1 Tax=Ralstonia sp. NFACC01 TaxID=1566294 RepID=UPI0008E9AD87|nr:diguanylate cyclase [Ralstonia sp. NFACC01]SFQ06090.1 diguanylate cyclase (GGDEF) domain-containing protein [Ralstonia sp. NFACC01]
MLIAALACAALVSIALIGLSWPRRDDAEVSAFMLLALGTALWSGARLMEVVTFDMPARVGWAKVAYLGIMMVPAAWLRMVVGLIRPELNALVLVRVGWLLALLVGAGFVGLVATNELHHLVWLDARFVVIDGIRGAVFEHGRMFWVATAYNYVLLAISLVLLVLPIDEVASGLYVSSRTQVRLALVIGQLLPLVAHLAYLQRWTTALGGDLTPATFAVSTALLGWIVLRPRLRDTAAYARGKIIEAMRDGCIVLARDGSIASINAAAKYLLPTAQVHAMPPAVLNVAGIVREFERTRLPNRYQVWLPDTGRTLEVTLEGLSDARGRHAGVFLLLRDVTVEQLQRAGMASAQDALRGELQRTRALLSVLENDVNRDALTQLFNRRFFETQAPRLFDHARRDKRPVTLALFDIDCFKQYNDTYGHLRGDDCLRMVADTLGMACRHPDDFIARVGGEEFVAMLFDLDRDEARQAVARAVAMVAERAEPHAASVAAPYVTLSAGAVTLTPADEHVDVLFEWADAALYDAKRSGRNTFRFHQSPPGLRSVAGRE